MIRSYRFAWSLFALLALFAPMPILAADNPTQSDVWNQFHGPGGRGILSAASPPLEWSESKNVRWKVALPGKAWSSPIIQSGKVWCSNATEDGKILSVVAVDLATGKKTLDKVLFEIPKPQFNIAYNSYASSTPAAGEGLVFVHFGSPGTACLDAKTGETVWVRRDLPCHHWRGAGSSPVYDSGKLYLCFDGYDFQYIACLEAKTGKTIWRTDRNITYDTDFGDYKKAFATPALIDIGGKRTLVCPSAGDTQGFDPVTGKLLWYVRHGGMNASNVPQSDGQRIFLQSGDGGFALHAVDPGNAPAGDITSKVTWKSNRGTPAYASILVKDGLLFYARDRDAGGTATCLEGPTGKSVWQERLGGGKLHASPVLVGERIYLFDDLGAGFVLGASATFKKLGGGTLEGGCMASPAIAGDNLLIRTKTHLYCVGSTAP